MFYFFLVIFVLAIFTLPAIALFDVITSKSDGLTDYQRSAKIIDRR